MLSDEKEWKIASISMESMEKLLSIL